MKKIKISIFSNPQAQLPNYISVEEHVAICLRIDNAMGDVNCQPRNIYVNTKPGLSQHTTIKMMCSLSSSTCLR